VSSLAWSHGHFCWLQPDLGVNVAAGFSLRRVTRLQEPYLVLIQKVVISCWCFGVGRPFLAGALVNRSL
jgi:hypothetical protein